MVDNINAKGYIVVKTANRVEAGPYVDTLHPVNFILLSEDYRFTNLVDAWIAREKLKNHEDYIILPYW